MNPSRQMSYSRYLQEEQGLKSGKVLTVSAQIGRRRKTGISKIPEKGKVGG